MKNMKNETTTTDFEKILEILGRDDEFYCPEKAIEEISNALAGKTEEEVITLGRKIGGIAALGK